jgi:hypothetical protein
MGAEGMANLIKATESSQKKEKMNDRKKDDTKTEDRQGGIREDKADKRRGK